MSAFRSATITFLVQGSDPKPYTVTFIKSGEAFNAYCTCPAGDKGLHCKHRVRILTGDSTGIVSCNGHELPTVKAWLTGSPMELALQRVHEAERKVLQAGKELTLRKQALTKVMHGKRTVST